MFHDDIYINKYLIPHIRKPIQNSTKGNLQEITIFKGIDRKT